MRYLAHTSETRQEMLHSIGVKNIDELFKDVPRNALNPDISLPSYQNEWEVEQAFRGWAAQNHQAGDGPCFLGGGIYRHHVPASVDHLIQRGEFLTSYTPYQPEIAQGTLQYLFEFQTQVCLLTGMDVANASMYDGATATVEAVMMANRVTGRKKVLLSGNLHPHYAEVIETYGRFSDFNVNRQSLDISTLETLIELLDDSLSCVVVQYPDFLGNIKDYRKLTEACHAKGTLLIVCVTEVVSLGLLPPPGQFGADVVTAEGQSLGVGLNFGGPTVGLFATKEKYLRQMPGRIVGQTVDLENKRGWVLTLSTREQHIRREKATSNICTNAGLCALAFTIHLSLLGNEGLKRLAKLNHYKAVTLSKALKMIPSVTILNKTFFNEFVVSLPRPADFVVEELAKRKILGGIPLSRFYPRQYQNLLLVACTETTTDNHIETFTQALKEIL
jgi:glycine dehydrogenase subunit 1